MSIEQRQKDAEHLNNAEKKKKENFLATNKSYIQDLHFWKWGPTSHITILFVTLLSLLISTTVTKDSFNLHVYINKKTSWQHLG